MEVGGRDEEEEKEVLMGLMVGTTYGFFRLNDETDRLSNGWIISLRLVSTRKSSLKN